jgi:hypothetical protein
MRALLNWDKVRLAIIDRHAEMEARNIFKFSVRNLHYYFKQVRPELGVGRCKNPYKELVSHITKWKRDYDIAESGINPDWFYDSSRPDATRVPEQTPEEYADDFAFDVRHAVDNYSVYRWFRQPIYVEVWVEKDAMTPIIKQMLADTGVRVVTCKGYIGDTKLREHVKRLENWWGKGRKIVVLYLGDLDPSGEDMDKILPARIREKIHSSLPAWDKDWFEVRQLAVKVDISHGSISQSWGQIAMYKTMKKQGSCVNIYEMIQEQMHFELDTMANYSVLNLMQWPQKKHLKSCKVC